MSALSELIMSRKSVRTFDGTAVGREDREKLEAFLSGIKDPFGIPVEFVLLDAKEHGLQSPVITGEKLYAAGKVQKVPYADVAFGYSFERFALYAWSLGIGTTWIGGTMKRELFEKAAGVREGEMMPCVSPLGYPAKKRSVREVVMRKAVGADSRMPAEKLFFENNWGTPLSGELRDTYAEPLEMVRWAPSAVNKQPWRLVFSEGRCHFYEKKDRGYVGEATGDLQKIDVGIALCHFVMGLEEQGKTPKVVIADPGIRIPEDAEYIATAEEYS